MPLPCYLPGGVGLLVRVMVAALLDDALEHAVGGQEHMEAPGHFELGICNGGNVIGEVRVPRVLLHPFAPARDRVLEPSSGYPLLVIPIIGLHLCDRDPRVGAVVPLDQLHVA
eukprot:30664-Pelagococcus_subviridis.AAC.3